MPNLRIPLLATAALTLGIGAPPPVGAQAVLLFEEDFEDGLAAWRFPTGEGYELVDTGEPGNHALALRTDALPALVLIEGSERWGGVRIEGRVLFPDPGHSYLGFVYRYADDGRRIDFGSLYIKGNDSYVQANPHHDMNVGRTLYPEARAPLEGDEAVRIGEWKDFALEVLGTEAHLYVGGAPTPSFTFPFAPADSGAFGFKARNPGDPVWIDDIRVWAIDSLRFTGRPRPDPRYEPTAHLREWEVLGPLTRMWPEVERAPWDRDLRIRDDGRTLGWTPTRTDARGALVTGSTTEYRRGRRVAYYRTSFTASAGPLSLSIATVDDLAIWLNGAFIGFAPRQAQAWWDAGVNPDHGPVVARVVAREGTNHLVVRVVGGDYATGGFFLRVGDGGS